MISANLEVIWAMSVYMSRLEFVLRKAGIETLITGGIVTNGGVASTVRDAHVRDFTTIVLSDGCAAFTEAAHRAAMASLATISAIATCAEAGAMIRAA